MNNQYYATLHLNPEKSYLKANVQWHLTTPNVDMINVYLHQDLTVDAITGDNLLGYEIGPENDSWSPFIASSRRITLKLQPNPTSKIEFSYSGSLEKVGDSCINIISPEWTELGIYAPWFPLTETYAPSHFDVTIKVPQQYDVIGSGHVEKTPDGYHIKQQAPHVDCSFLMSNRFSKQHHTHQFGNSRINLYYIDPNSEGRASRLKDYIGDIMDLYTSHFGAIDQEHFNIVLVPRDNSQDGGGYNRPNLVVLPDLTKAVNVNTVKYKQDELGDFQYLAHELAHLWWSKADVRNYEDWLNESFAQYACLLATKRVFGEEQFQTHIDEYEASIKSLPAIFDLPRDHDAAFETLYIKGPYLLHQLHLQMGEDFYSLLRQLHQQGIHTTEGFNKCLTDYNTEIAKQFMTTLKK